MKKFIALVALALVSVSTMMYAQESNREVHRADRKAQRDTERARLKIEEQAADQVACQQTVRAIKDKQFILEADQAIFKRGQTAFVSSSANFVILNGQRAIVQVAFNTLYPGSSGIGGVAVDRTTSDVKVATDKGGNINCNFSVQGIGISAQVFITLTNGENNATVTINPNFDSNTLTLSGNLAPLSQSDVLKDRLW